MKLKLPYTILIFFVFSLPKSLAQNSVLAKGDWVKIGVANAGIYKLDASFFQKVGFNIAQINPQNIKIYGNGGGMLPQANNISRPKDLIENAIAVEGETDEKFDNQDFVLFYGQSPHKIMYDSLSKSFSHQFNLYADTTFYFLTVSETKGLRIKDQNSISATQEISTFDDYDFHEVDRKNILAQAPFAGSGREWVGEEFSGNLEQIFTFNQTGIIVNSPLKIITSLAASAFGQTEFAVKANGLSVGTTTLNAIGEDRYDYKGSFSSKSFIINPDFTNATDLKIGLTYNRKSLNAGVGYLNFLGVQTVRNLKLYGNQTAFRSLESLKYYSVKFSLNETNTNLKIWDISNPFLPQNQLFTVQNQKIVFGINSTSLKEFIVYNNAGFLEPISSQKIKNQNLQNLEIPDLLIVTSESLRKQANRLADFRRQHDKLVVQVVSTQEIYHEFSSGRQDISAIRDFVKTLYERNSTKLKYLLLFGDASFDYKKRLNVITNETKEILIPTYQSRESLHPIYSFSSDDYYGFLSNNEGTWEENGSGNHTLEIGIGRLPVKSVQEADDIVNKLIHYSADKTTVGDWRSKLAFIADNGDGNIHQEDADSFAKKVDAQTGVYKKEKVYLDAFPLVSLPEGQRSPEAKKAINQAFQNGVLIMNYNGHGAESGWTDEQILSISDIVNLTNYNTLPLMLTATCQFGRFDDPNQVSGAELSLLNAKGGAIALLTTTRPVFQNTNFVINQAFYESIFKPINGQMPRLGDVMVYTKNNSLQGVINRNFTLLGDPSLRLNYPENDVILTKINGKTILQGDTLKALTKVVLEGEIVTRDSKTKNTNFNGIAQITVYDKQKNLQTLGNQGSKFVYQDYQNKLFDGQVKVQNGSFLCSFVVPKDINYQYGEGKIFVYAQTTDATSDGLGSSKLIVGGANNQSLIDNQPPKIKMFLNDETFVDGGQTNNSPVLIAKISDENGINIATDGLGHQLLLTIDDTSKVFVNQHFTNSLDDYTSGQIQYNFTNLPIGKHKLKLKIWDNYNNSTESTLRFEVNSAKNNLLKSVFCYPNPFIQTTNFSFEHERVGEDFNVIIEIYDSYGRLIKQISENVYQISSPFDKISWNLAEDSVPIVTGNYFYRIFAKSLTTSYQASGSGKIVSVK